MKIRTTLLVEGMVAGRQRAASSRHGLVVALDGEVVSLRDLIEAIVRGELEACASHSAEARLVRVLTENVPPASGPSGANRHRDDAATPIDADHAVRTALDAHRNGQVQAIVDNQPITDPDALLDVVDGTRVRFVRDASRSAVIPKPGALISS